VDRGGGQAHVEVHTENLKIYDIRVKRIFLMTRLKKDHQKFWQMKYKEFTGRTSKIRKIFEKRGNFFRRHVDVHKGERVRLM